MDWDAFISHASEDKNTFARPLYQQLQKLGLKIWFDEFTLTVGDSLRRSIDAGLARSRFGIVIISPSFLKKEWPQRELDGLVAREVAGVKVILPVWHQLSAHEILTYSPTLADRLAASSSEGVEQVALRLYEAIRKQALPTVVRQGHEGSEQLVSASDVYCYRCGATPGRRSECIGGTTHSFTSSSGKSVYCYRCGAVPGPRSECIGGTTHSFASSSGKSVYCYRCGAVPGPRSECIGGTTHSFTSR